MTKHQFITGMGMGLAAGAALGMAMSGTRKREIKRAADKAIKAVGEVMENLSDKPPARLYGQGALGLIFSCRNSFHPVPAFWYQRKSS